MFVYDNFCHGASNDRAQNQSAIFLYKTVDTLQQMTTAGYFNRAKLDLHIGDIIFATVESIKETTSYNTYVFRVLTVNEPITVEQISLDALTTEQMAAVNSGITAEHVASYDAYAGEISAAQSTADKADNAAEVAQQTANLAGQEAAQALTALAGKVNIAQGAENAGKVMTVGEDGNVVPTAGYATQSWVETQITNSIGSIETALAEV